MEILQNNQALFNSLYTECCSGGQFMAWSTKIPQLADYQRVKQMSEPDRLSLVRYCVDEIASYYCHLPYFEDELKAINHHNLATSNFSRKYFSFELVHQICRYKFSLQENDIGYFLTVFDEVIDSMIHKSNMNEVYAYNELLYNFPTSFLFRQLENLANENGLSARMKEKLTESFFNKVIPIHSHSSKLGDVINNVFYRLFSHPTPKDQYPAVFISEEDTFGQVINQSVQQSTPDQRNILYGFLAHYKKASGGKPSGKYIQEVQRLYEQLGDPAVYTRIVKQWLIGFKQTEVQSQLRTNSYSGREYTYSTYNFLHEINPIIAKGIVWSLVGLVE